MIPVLTLVINLLAPGLYEARCDGAPESPTTHKSISEALRYYGSEIPQEFSQYVDVHYGGISSGTTLISRLLQEAELMASELVRMSNEVGDAVDGKNRPA